MHVGMNADLRIRTPTGVGWISIRHSSRHECRPAQVVGRASARRTVAPAAGIPVQEAGPRFCQAIASQASSTSIIAMNTPAEPKSFASPESWCVSVLMRSTTRSMAELNISASSTSPQEPSSSTSSTASCASTKASGASGTSMAHSRRKAVSCRHAVRSPCIENANASTACNTPRRPSLRVCVSIALAPLTVDR